jgi:SEC-C motif-containing protein
MANAPITPPQPQPDQPCPCGSGKLFGDCCEPVISGQRLAATAEQLMRARFTAHVTHDALFLHRTYRPTSGQKFVEDPSAPTLQWKKLVVHAHEPGANPDTAFVSFTAYGEEQGIEQVLEEKAEFVRQHGALIYTRAVREGPVPYKAAVPKPGRNDPCPCGSGRKYKQCCLLKA